MAVSQVFLVREELPQRADSPTTALFSSFFRASKRASTAAVVRGPPSKNWARIWSATRRRNSDEPMSLRAPPSCCQRYWGLLCDSGQGLFAVAGFGQGPVRSLLAELNQRIVCSES